MTPWSQTSVMHPIWSCNVCGGVAYTCCSMYPHRKKSSGVKSGEIGDHFSTLPYPIISQTLRHSCLQNIFSEAVMEFGNHINGYGCVED
ncbi:hypothetical protein TNCV_221581 [Trichonephila clavipes]|nr:hypothetical protein TNCV_221581 [Trichonephila clavipes]